MAGEQKKCTQGTPLPGASWLLICLDPESYEVSSPKAVYTLCKVTQKRLWKTLMLFQDSLATWLGLHLIVISLLRWVQIPPFWGWKVHFIHLIDWPFIQVSWEEAKWFWIYLLNSNCYPLYLCHVPSCLSSSKLNSPNLFTLSSFRSLFTSP